MSIFTIILMLAAAAVMIFGLMKSKQGVPWGKPVTIAGAAVVLLLALISVMDSGPGVEKLKNITERYHEVKGTKLGRYLAENFEGQSAAFLMPYQAQGEDLDPNRIAFLDSLREELTPAIEVTGQMTPEPPASVQRQQEEMRRQIEEMSEEQGEEALPPEEMMLGMSMYDWFTGRQLDALIADYDEDCDLLVAIADLPSPRAPTPPRFWGRSNAPKVVLTSGSVYEYYRHIKNGVVVAAVAHNPNADYQEKPAKKVDEAFNQRYVLVTPDNVDEVAEKYPKMFDTDND